MKVPQRVCSECSDDNGSVPSVIWLLSAEYCQCQQSSGAPATEYDPRQPWNHPESGAAAADLSRFLRAKSRYQDTQSTIVFPVNNSSRSLFNLPSCGVKPVHSYNLETTAPKLATAPLVAAPALQYGVCLQVLSGYGQI